MTRPLMIATAAAMLALPVSAQDHAPFTYADFEVSVPHIDLDECPAGLAEGDVFCRVTMNNDALHIYVFERGGEQNFVLLHTRYEDEFQLLFDN